MSDEVFKRKPEDQDYETEGDEFSDDVTDGFEEEEEVTISVTSDDDEDHADLDGEEVLSATVPPATGLPSFATLAAPKPNKVKTAKKPAPPKQPLKKSVAKPITKQAIVKVPAKKAAKKTAKPAPAKKPHPRKRLPRRLSA